MLVNEGVKNCCSSLQLALTAGRVLQAEKRPGHGPMGEGESVAAKKGGTSDRSLPAVCPKHTRLCVLLRENEAAWGCFRVLWGVGSVQWGLDPAHTTILGAHTYFQKLGVLQGTQVPEYRSLGHRSCHLTRSL